MLLNCILKATPMKLAEIAAITLQVALSVSMFTVCAVTLKLLFKPKPLPEAAQIHEAFLEKVNDIVGKLVLVELATDCSHKKIMKFGQCVDVFVTDQGLHFARCLDSKSNEFFALIYDCFWDDYQKAYVERV